MNFCVAQCIFRLAIESVKPSEVSGELHLHKNKWRSTPSLRSGHLQRSIPHKTDALSQPCNEYRTCCVCVCMLSPMPTLVLPGFSGNSFVCQEEAKRATPNIPNPTMNVAKINDKTYMNFGWAAHSANSLTLKQTHTHTYTRTYNSWSLSFRCPRANTFWGLLGGRAAAC